MQLLEYNSVPEIAISDHKPVKAFFQLDVRFHSSMLLVSRPDLGQQIRAGDDGSKGAQSGRIESGMPELRQPESRLLGTRAPPPKPPRPSAQRRARTPSPGRRSIDSLQAGSDRSVESDNAAARHSDVDEDYTHVDLLTGDDRLSESVHEAMKTDPSLISYEMIERTEVTASPPQDRRSVQTADSLLEPFGVFAVRATANVAPSRPPPLRPPRVATLRPAASNNAPTTSTRPPLPPRADTGGMPPSKG